MTIFGPDAPGQAGFSPGPNAPGRHGPPVRVSLSAFGISLGNEPEESADEERGVAWVNTAVDSAVSGGNRRCSGAPASPRRVGLPSGRARWRRGFAGDGEWGVGRDSNAGCSRFVYHTELRFPSRSRG